MKKVSYILFLPLVLCSFLLMSFVLPPDEDNLVVNGSFETGDFTGWIRDDLSGAGIWDVYTGTPPPLFFPPPVGDFAATTFQFSPDSNILYQDIQLPENSEITCSAIVYYINEALIGGGVESETFTKGLVAADPGNVTAERIFIIGDGLNINQPNQQYRVDIMDPDAPPFDTGAGVLMNLFQTLPGDPDIRDYTTLNFDLTHYAGQTVRIRAAVAVTENPLFGAIDDVTCTWVPTARPIPTLSQWGLIAMAGLIGIIGLLAVRRKKLAA